MRRFEAEPLDYPALVDRLEGRLIRFVQGYIRDPHTAQDIVQETFLRVVRNLHRYRGQSSLTTWIYSIARNLCLDHLKTSRTRLRLLEVEPAEREVPDSLCPDPFRPIERAENCARVGRALTGLSRENQDLVIMRVYLGLSPREIARRSQGSPASVRSRIARALKSLTEGLS